MCHLNVLDYTSGDLPPTRTYGRRSWLWIPADREHPTWDRRLGNLTLKLQHAKRGVRRNLELDTYAVEEQDAIPGLMGRVFLLVNLTDPEQDQPYQTVIGPNPSCTCKAAICKVPEPCKHLAGLTHLIENEIIPSEALAHVA